METFKLDFSKRLTQKKLRFPEAKKVMLIVYRIEDYYGSKVRQIWDIFSGTHAQAVYWANKERSWWTSDEILVEVAEEKRP